MLHLLSMQASAVSPSFSVPSDQTIMPPAPASKIPPLVLAEIQTGAEQVAMMSGLGHPLRRRRGHALLGRRMPDLVTADGTPRRANHLVRTAHCSSVCMGFTATSMIATLSSSVNVQAFEWFDSDQKATGGAFATTPLLRGSSWMRSLRNPQLAQVPFPRHHAADWVGRRRDSCVLTP
jgi:hypothetical protein